MSREADDQQLKTVFEGLRQEDERLTPPFERMWKAAALGVKAGRAVSAVRLAACAALGLALGIGTALVLTPRRAVVVSRASTRPSFVSVGAISRWRSPTSFFLRAPGEELLRTVPRVGEVFGG